MEDSDVSGFMPLKKNNTGFHIDNYYIRDDDSDTIDGLLDSITEDIPGDVIVTALVHKRHVNDFWRNHFNTIKELSNYDMMHYVFMRFKVAYYVI